MGHREICHMKNTLAREILAEFVGTFILVTFIIASGAQYVLSGQNVSGPLITAMASGIGLTLGIYWSGGVSGGSLNPAVTLGLCLNGVIKWRKFPFYTIAELCGAFLAAAVQYGIYYDAIKAFDGGERVTNPELPNATAGIFATFPKPFASTATCFFDQVFGTFILVGSILAITDKRNMKPDSGLTAIAIGLILFGIGICFALNCGYAINPARDLGPRIFTAIAGWGTEPFSYRNYNWFWIPIVAPMVGALLAWGVYKLAVSLHWPEGDSYDCPEPVQGTRMDALPASTVGSVNKGFQDGV